MSCQTRNAGIAAAVLLAVMSMRLTSAQPLPEGDTGIAARYANDVGIDDDPAVFFHEDFEATFGTTLTAESSSFDTVYGANKITRVAENVHGGTRAVERIHSSPGSFGAVRYLGAGYDLIHLRYYMKYHAEFPGCHHTGGGIYAAAGARPTQIGDITGIKPDGTNHFQVWLDDLPPFFDWSPSGNNTAPGWANLYCYNMDQGSQWGDVILPDGVTLPGSSGVDFGPTFSPRPNFVAVRGRWYAFEIMLRANTPGRRDGRLAFWIDGRLAGDFQNLQLRSTADLKPNHIAISTYSSRVDANKTLWYDDVVAATSYIGPMYSGLITHPDIGAFNPDASLNDAGAGFGGEVGAVPLDGTMPHDGRTTQDGATSPSGTRVNSASGKGCAVGPYGADHGSESTPAFLLILLLLTQRASPTAGAAGRRRARSGPHP